MGKFRWFWMSDHLHGFWACVRCRSLNITEMSIDDSAIGLGGRRSSTSNGWLTFVANDFVTSENDYICQLEVVWWISKWQQVQVPWIFREIHGWPQKLFIFGKEYTWRKTIETFRNILVYLILIDRTTCVGHLYMQSAGLSNCKHLEVKARSNVKSDRVCHYSRRKKK